MSPTIFDDAVSLIAVSLGVLGSAVATMSVIPNQEIPPKADVLVIATTPIVVSEGIIDFAIIRGDPVITVGPEDPYAGWRSPAPLLPSR